MFSSHRSEYRFLAGPKPCPRRCAFTLYELLIVIAVLAVLTGILIPVISKARTAAMNVVCVGRLKDLMLATQSYQLDCGVLPEPAAVALSTGSDTGLLAATPQSIDTRLFRQLQKYLKYPTVTTSTNVKDLPPFMQCPFVENEEKDRGPFVTMDPADVYYYTGYAYVGRVEEMPVPQPTLLAALGLGPLPPALSGPILPLGTITLGPLTIESGLGLKKNRAATAKPQNRGVVWTDDVHMDGPSGYWQYAHVRSRPSDGPKRLTKKDVAALSGQHRAYIDGTVDWAPRDDMGLTEPNPGQSKLDLTASFKNDSNSYWWY